MSEPIHIISPRDWKLRVITKTVREFFGLSGKRVPAGHFTQWIGISLDEVSRAKDSREAHTIHRFPLLEKRMTRHNCESWLTVRNFHPPKSACVYCPYRGPAQWRKSKAKGGAEWDLIRKVSSQLVARGEFLTAHCLPIDEVDFSTEEERGQLNMFNNECEGMCGV